MSFRFWQSTAAYTIASECGMGEETTLPPEGHWVYEWPKDLLVPNVVILLTVSEDVRDQRVQRRNVAQTGEENRIASDINYRQR